LAVSSQRGHKSEGKLKICKPSKELVRKRKDYVISREITTILKIAVDNATLELCDSCDFFASPFLKGKKRIKFNRESRKKAVVNLTHLRS